MTAILRLPEVLNRTGLSRTTLYSRIQAGDFPRSVPLGTSTIRGGRVVPTKIRGWLESEVDAWMDKNMRARAAEVEEARGHA